MVVRTKQELDERISNGWGITIKNDRFYVQKRMGKGKVVTEIVGKNLDDYARQLYEEIRGHKPEEKPTRREKQKEAKAEKLEKDIEKEIAKKTKQSVVKHLAKALDKRTEYLIQWGLWVEANILPKADGETWEEKAKSTIEVLNMIKDSVGQVITLADENDKLKKENKALKDMLRVLMEKTNTIKHIKELLNKAIVSGAPKETVLALIQALINYGSGNGDKKWSNLMQL